MSSNLPAKGQKRPASTILDGASEVIQKKTPPRLRATNGEAYAGPPSPPLSVASASSPTPPTNPTFSFGDAVGPPKSLTTFPGPPPPPLVSKIPAHSLPTVYFPLPRPTPPPFVLDGGPASTGLGPAPPRPPLLPSSREIALHGKVEELEASLVVAREERKQYKEHNLTLKNREQKWKAERELLRGSLRDKERLLDYQRIEMKELEAQIQEAHAVKEERDALKLRCAQLESRMKELCADKYRKEG